MALLTSDHQPLTTRWQHNATMGSYNNGYNVKLCNPKIFKVNHSGKFNMQKQCENQIKQKSNQAKINQSKINLNRK